MNKKTTAQKFAYIPLAKIEPSKYQRVTKSAQVDSIVKNFDEAKLGALTVSSRDDLYFIVDGAHRLSALRTLNYTHALCEILTGLTFEQESDYFMRQGQDNRPLKPIDLFSAGIIAGDGKCLKIDAIVRANNFHIGFAYKDFYQIGAIQTLFTIVDDYGYEVLDGALRLISGTWAGIAKASGGECLLGTAEFVHRYGIVELNERVSDSFSALWHEYKESTRRSQTIKARKCFCRILVDFHNKGLGSRSKHRLQWED